ncbi:MAG TPA: hypothetical protein VIJ86_09745 [Acidimicrobiales bacterium]
MVDEIVGDPFGSIWRWVLNLEIRPHWLRAILGSLVLPVIAAIVYPVFIFDPTASLRERIWAGVAAAGIAFGGFLILRSLLVLAVAPYEQRKALRDVIESRETKISEKDTEIARLRSDIAQRTLDKDHEAGIREALAFVEEEVRKDHIVGFEPSAMRDSLIGHLPSVIALVDEWDMVALANDALRERLRVHSEHEIATFDYHVYSHETLRDIFSFAVQRAGTSESEVPFLIPWEPQNDQAPDEVRINRSANQSTFAARATDEITRETAMARIQQFLGDVMMWPEVNVHGDIKRVAEFQNCKSRLLIELQRRRDQHGYVFATGCSRCPQ